MFSCLSCFYLSYTLPICGLFYLVLLASTLSRYSLFCADGTLNPFTHSLTHLKRDHMIAIDCVVHSTTDQAEFPTAGSNNFLCMIAVHRDQPDSVLYVCSVEDTVYLMASEHL